LEVYLGMSFLRDVERFSAEKLKPVQTTVTTAGGRKVKDFFGLTRDMNRNKIEATSPIFIPS